MTWATGVAEVVGTSARGVAVLCPHCGRRHVHGRGSVGSNHVVAGCHRGFKQSREYAVRDFGAARKGGAR